MSQPADAPAASAPGATPDPKAAPASAAAAKAATAPPPQAAPGGAGNASTTADSTPATKPPETKTAAEQTAHRLMARVVDMEERHRTEQATWKTEREKLAGEAKQLSEAKAAYDKLLDHAKADPFKALEALGLDFEALTERYLDGLKPPTAEQTVEQIVEKRLAAEREAAEKRAADEAAERTKAEQARIDAGIAGYQSGIAEAFAASPDAYDLCASLGVTKEDVWVRADAELRTTGKLPSPAEALALMEADLEKRVRASKKFAAQQAAQAAAASTSDKQDSSEPTAKDTRPRSLSKRHAGSVPVSRQASSRSRAESLAKAKAAFGVE